MRIISLGEKLDPELRGRIIGVQGQMIKFEYFFGINILQILLLHSDNLSKTLQSPKFSNLTVKTLISLRSDTLFNNLWEKLKKEANTLGIEEPSLPRKRKRNGKLLSKNKTQFYCDIEEVAIYYKRVYFNHIDIIVACMQDRFNQPGFRACQNILLNAVNNKNYE